MALPDPDLVEHELETAVREFVKDYRWAYNLAHQSPNTGEVKVSGGATSDPTAGAMLSQDHVRRTLRRAIGRSDKAKEILGQAHDIIDEAFDRADRRCEPLDVGTVRNATSREVKDATAAQQRRQGRGEGFGAS